MKPETFFGRSLQIMVSFPVCMLYNMKGASLTDQCLSSKRPPH